VVSCKTISFTTNYPIAFYEIESAGSPPQLKVRLISDYSSIAGGQIFKLGFFFKLQSGWYTYSNEKNKDNIPTDISINLPDGFTILSEQWPEPKIIRDKTGIKDEKVYDADFKVIYTIKASDKLPDLILITANSTWQVCKSSLCTLGGAQLKYKMLSGKKRKSNLDKLLN